MNSFHGIGRLTRDPELKYTPNGTAVANFSIAINRRFNKEQTDFIDLVAWKQTAEYVANYGGKGRLIAVEGELQVRSYEKDGQKRKVSEVVVSQVQFLDKQQKGESAPGADTEWEALGRVDEAIETNHYLEQKLELAISDIESLCVDYYKNADDYDVMADMCNQYCVHGKEKGCFQADPDIPSRCVKFQWKGIDDERR